MGWILALWVYYVRRSCTQHLSELDITLVTYQERSAQAEGASIALLFSSKSYSFWLSRHILQNWWAPNLRYVSVSTSACIEWVTLCSGCAYGSITPPLSTVRQSSTNTQQGRAIGGTFYEEGDWTGWCRLQDEALHILTWHHSHVLGLIKTRNIFWLTAQEQQTLNNRSGA